MRSPGTYALVLPSLAACALLSQGPAYGAPPAGQAIVTAAPSTLVLDSEASALLTARPAVGQPAGQPRFVAAIGAVEAGRYTPGDRRAPAIGLVAAALPLHGGGETRGATTITLVGRGELPTTTSPGASVTIEVAGRSFGPILADPDGRATVAVEVPPGATTAHVVAIDPRGRSTARDLPLPAMPYPRAVAIGPERLAAGTTGVVTLFALDADGAWLPAGSPPPVVTASDGLELVSIAARAPGRWDATVRAAPTPTAGAAGSVGFALAGTEVARVAVPLLPPPARSTRPQPVALPALLAGSVRIGLRAGPALKVAGRAGASVAIDALFPLSSRARALFIGPELGATRLSLDDGDRLLEGHLAITTHLRLVGRDALAAVAVDGYAGAGLALGQLDAASAPDSAIEAEIILMAGTAVAYQLGNGELVVDGRYTDLRFGPTLGVPGSAMGLVITAGFRIAL